jgi:uncharacterized protein (TIRG00374 family)
MFEKGMLLLYLKVLFTLFLFYLIFQWVDFDEFVLAISSAEPLLLLIAVLLWPVTLIVTSLRWKLILKEHSIGLSLWETVDISWISSFFNNFLPTSFGGDSYRFIRINALMQQRKVDILSSLLIDRGLGLVAMMLLSCLSGLLFWAEVASAQVLLTIYLGIWAGTLLVLVVIFSPVQFALKREFPLRFFNQVRDLFNVLGAFKKHKVLLKVTSLSLLFYLINIYATYLVFLAFNVEISFLLLVF